MMRSIADRADAIFREQMLAEYQRVDRIFRFLFVVEWLSAILVALVISPYAWAGETASIHIHVWTAIILGGAIASLPIALTLLYSGKATHTSLCRSWPDPVDRSVYPSLGRADRVSFPHLRLTCVLGFLS